MNSTTDYVTYVKADKPINKRFTAEGVKHPALPLTDGEAITVPVPDAHALRGVLETCAEDPCAVLIAGYIPGATQYRLLSMDKIIKRTGTDDPRSGPFTIDGVTTYARTKDNFAPSSWIVFDCDVPDGMPPELVASNIDQWCGWMDNIVPGFAGARKVVLPSNSTRVVNGSALNYHVYVQTQDAQDRTRFGSVLLPHAFAKGFGFSRDKHDKATRVVVGSMPWTIFDPGVFGAERLFYDGAPVTTQPLAPAVIEARPGVRLDTSQLGDPGEDALHKFHEATGLRFDAGTRCFTDEQTLKLDTVLDTVKGTMTVGDYIMSGHNKLRCQAPFRDSDSFAAFIDHSGPGVLLFDSGTHINYLLNPEAATPADAPPPPDDDAPLFVSLAEAWQEDQHPASWIVEDLLPDRGVAYLVSPPGVGKSTLVTAISACLATGTPFMGLEVQQGPVLYLDAEDRAYLLTRFRAWEKVNGISPAPGMYVSPRDASIALNRPEVVEQLVTGLVTRINAEQGRNPVAIFIDTQSSATEQLKENATEDMEAFMKLMISVSNRLECLVVILHHPSKAGDALRGSLTQRGKAVTILNLQGDGKSKARELWVDKQRHGRSNYAALKLSPREVPMPQPGKLTLQKVMLFEKFDVNRSPDTWGQDARICFEVLGDYETLPVRLKTWREDCHARMREELATTGQRAGKTISTKHAGRRVTQGIKELYDRRRTTYTPDGTGSYLVTADNLDMLESPFAAAEAIMADLLC